MKQTGVLSGILGFFFTVTLFLVLFNNCSFSFGCGKGHQSNLMEKMKVKPVMMREINTNNEKSEPPQANDNTKGYATIDASGSEHPQPLKMMHPQNDKPTMDEVYAMPPPMHPPFRGDAHLGGSYTNIGGVPN